MQIEMRIHYKDGHQDIMLNLNCDCFPYFNYESLESLHAEFNQDHIPYLQKYMHITVSSEILVIAALRIH